MDEKLTPLEKEVLRAVARDAVRSSVLGLPFETTLPNAGRLAAPGSAFVTLHRAGRLAGCIGLIGDRFPLALAVREAAVRARSDPRFPALRPEDLEAVEIEISVLGPPRPLADRRRLEPGRHGIHATLGARSGLFLPQVATEQGWDRERLLVEVCRKAGLAPAALDDPRLDLAVFEAEVF